MAPCFVISHFEERQHTKAISRLPALGNFHVSVRGRVVLVDISLPKKHIFVKAFMGVVGISWRGFMTPAVVWAFLCTVNIKKRTSKPD